MAAADEHARIYIYKEEGGIDVLLTILESYTNRNDHEPKDPDSDPDLHLIGTDLGGSDGSNEDVLIKTVRVVANLCLAEKVGRGLAAEHAERTVKALLACLRLAERNSEDMDNMSEDGQERGLERREELATAALATLNNITFYREPPEPPDPTDATDRALDDVCKATCRWLSGSGGAACEAVRALGNVSRGTRAAQLIVLEGVLDGLPSFLDHEDESVRCAAAGVLVNVCGAGVSSAACGAVAAQALCVSAARGDSSAAALLARALWNAHAHAPLKDAYAHRAAAALTSFIDDESVFEACEQCKMDDRRASDPALFKHVTFEIDNNNCDKLPKPLSKAVSVDNDIHLDGQWSDSSEFCGCEPCRRVAAWDELAAVAIPLLDALSRSTADAAVGTE